MNNRFISPYESLGGEQFLSKLVNSFYEKVGNDPILSPIFPDDLTETARKQKLFLTQFLGGPPLYSEEFGHPMLRARHMPFEITPTRAKRWLELMSAAMDDVGLEGELRTQIFQRLILTAQHMINTPDDQDQGKGESQ